VGNISASKKCRSRWSKRHNGGVSKGGIAITPWCLLKIKSQSRRCLAFVGVPIIKTTTEAAAVGVFHQQHPIRLKNLLIGFAGVQEPLVEKTQRRRFRRRMIFSPSQECKSRWSKRHNGGDP